MLKFQGLNKDKERSLERQNETSVSNSFWVYSINQNKWQCFYKNENSCLEYWNKRQFEEPRPRYAHQLVYDDVNRVSKTHAYDLRCFYLCTCIRFLRQLILRQNKQIERKYMYL